MDNSANDNGSDFPEFLRFMNRQDFSYKNKWNKAVDSMPPILKFPAGFWEIYCDSEEIDHEGLTEKDRVWASVKELVNENIFIQASYKGFDSYSSTVAIKCFVEDYSDLDKVIQSASEMRRRIHYPGVFYMKTNSFNEIGKSLFNTRYLYCCDGDLYERSYTTHTGFRLLKRNLLTNK